jgi:predicted dehydrogenase
MEPLAVGVLGCGTISETYLSRADRFEEFEIVACADLDGERAEATAADYGLSAGDPAWLYESAGVDIVLNLTPPSVHAETSRRALEAGNHVYTEKPLAVSADDAASVLETADRVNRRVGVAPDTFLGAGLQTCRRLVDDGRIGEPVGATVAWVSGGHEHWHPNPDLYYREGGGPLFDMGPYYVTALVSILGPVRRVTGSVARTTETRTVTSQPRAGESIAVEVPTHEAGVVDFETGAVATVLTTFDAPGGSSLSQPAFELYGTEGTLSLPDPNRFDGPVRLRKRGADEFESVPLSHEYTHGRGVGLADLAHAVAGDWQQRASGALGAHVLEVLEGVRTASDQDEHVSLDRSVERPPPVPPGFFTDSGP